MNEILDFSANINPLGMSKEINMVLEEALLEASHYPDPDYKALMVAVCHHEAVKEDHIVLASGGIEGIFLLAEHLKLKKIQIQGPTFVEYARAFSKYGSSISYDFLNHENFLTDMDSFIEKLDSDIDGILLCNPNNPTGVLIEKIALKKLLDYAEQHKIFLIIDEAFIDFVDKLEGSSMVDYIESYKYLIIIKSLTKFYGIPGLRLGYLMAGDKRLVSEIKNNRMPWAINSMAANFGVASLSDQSYIASTRDYILTERKLFLSQLNDIASLKVFPSQGNYIFFYTEVFDLDDQLKPYGIMIRNCSNYMGLEAGYFRVAIKKRQDNQQLIDIFNKILSD
jgi:threonine-phosphate decarboxylase